MAVLPVKMYNLGVIDLKKKSFTNTHASNTHL